MMKKRNRLAMTLVEVVIASTIGAVVSFATAYLVLEVAREQKRGLVDAQANSIAVKVQDRIERTMRSMSRSDSIAYGQPVTLDDGSKVYRTVVMSSGIGNPLESLTFDPDAQTLTHDPNRAVANDEIVLAKSGRLTKLRDVHFAPSMKAGGVPDNSTVNVWVEFDDNGASGRKSFDETEDRYVVKPTRVVRSFTVTFRNH
ncbi:hypothetical protein KQI84_06390 [bacterium]|nr:hypothetical protein [bacterium]